MPELCTDETDAVLDVVSWGAEFPHEVYVDVTLRHAAAARSRPAAASTAGHAASYADG